MKKVNLIGVRFGRLTVVSEAGKNKSKHIEWLCRCDCGNEKIVLGDSLRRGITNSCGCYAAEKTVKRNFKHGFCQERLYKIWWGMKMRTCNKKRKEYKNYGGRGIVLCDEWLNDYLSFRNWALNNGYRDNLSIDRIDVNGNYEPSNCRWANDKEQANNVRNNHLLIFDGKAQNITQWSEETGIPRTTISSRLNRSKWSTEKTLNHTMCQSQ